jgi:hypothetical protein
MAVGMGANRTWLAASEKRALVKRDPICPMCLEHLRAPDHLREVLDAVGDAAVPVLVYCARCDWTGREAFYARGG